MTSHLKLSGMNAGSISTSELPAQCSQTAGPQLTDFDHVLDSGVHESLSLHTVVALQVSATSCRKPIRKRKSRRRRLSGWKRTTGLRWTEVKGIGELDHLAQAAGSPLNLFISINPEETIITDSDRKRACYKLEGNFASRLKRRGVPFVAIRVFEKKSGGLLHLHLLVHVPSELVKTAVSWSTPGTTIKMRKDVHLNYITKQRHPLPPDLEQLTKHKRQKSTPFKGRRWSVSKAFPGKHD
jgi:hypothetical protein